MRITLKNILVTIFLIIIFNHVKGQDSLIFNNAKPIEKIVNWNNRIIFLSDNKINEFDSLTNKITDFQLYNDSDVIDFIAIYDTLIILTFYKKNIKIYKIIKNTKKEIELPNDLTVYIDDYYQTERRLKNIKDKKLIPKLGFKGALKFCQSSNLELITRYSLYSLQNNSWIKTDFPEIITQFGHQFKQPQDGICIIKNDTLFCGLFYGEFGGAFVSINISNPNVWKIYNEDDITGVAIDKNNIIWLCSGLEMNKTSGKLTKIENGLEKTIFQCFGYYRGEPTTCDSVEMEIDNNCCIYFNEPITPYNLSLYDNNLYILADCGIYKYDKIQKFELITKLNRLYRPTCFFITKNKIFVGTDRYGLIVCEKVLQNTYTVKQFIIN